MLVTLPTRPSCGVRDCTAVLTPPPWVGLGMTLRAANATGTLVAAPREERRNGNQKLRAVDVSFLNGDTKDIGESLLVRA